MRLIKIPLDLQAFSSMLVQKYSLLFEATMSTSRFDVFIDKTCCDK